MITADAFATTIPLDDARGEVQDEIDPSLWVDDLDARDFLARGLLTLTPREERVIRLRFGIGGVEDQSQAEIAKAWGCTNTNIARIERVAMRKLRYRAVKMFPGREFAPDVEVPKSYRRAKVPLRPSAARAGDRTSRNDGTRTASYGRSVYHNNAEILERRREEDEARKGDERRTRLYREWLAERDKTRPPKAGNRSTERRTTHQPAISSDSVEQRRANRAWTRFCRIIASVLMVPASLYAITLTQGHPGYLTFKAVVGSDLEPIVRLLTCLLGMGAFPVFLIISIWAIADFGDDIRKPLR